jgi:LPS export ABC transporter protein LptC
MMNFFTRFKIQKLKILLTVIIVLSVGSVLCVFLLTPDPSGKEDDSPPAQTGEPSMTIGKVHQESVRDGKKEWSLDADTVEYMEEQQKAVFQGPAVTFYLKDGREAHLMAQQGILKTESNDLEVSGHVVIKFDKYRLETEKLNYEHQRRIIFGTVPVKITGDAFHLAADSVFVELNDRRASFEGNIKGSINGRIPI